MAFETSLDHIDSIGNDIDYVSTILNDHLPKPDGSGRPWVNMPSFVLDQSERNQIIEIAKSIVTRVSEINQELNHHTWEPYTQKPTEFAQRLYATALQLNQTQYPDDASLFQPLGELKNSINYLETNIKIIDAMNKGTSQKKYSEQQVSATVNELEKKKRETRLKVYNKIDPNLEKLSINLEHQNSNVLDKSISKLLHLVGFDTEIYDPELAGNIDVIATDSLNEIVVICENTTGKLSKKKIDQIIGRQNEYEGEYKPWKNCEIYPILVSTAEDIFTDDLARRECVLNGIAVLTKKELKELIKNIKKGKMSPTLFADYIKKKIPKS